MANPRIQKLIPEYSDKNALNTGETVNVVNTPRLGYTLGLDRFKVLPEGPQEVYTISVGV